MIVRMQFEEKESVFASRVEEQESVFSADFGEITEVGTSGRKMYEGEYTVIPSKEEHVLKTSGKVMNDDVTVKAIPYHSTSNTAGGETVYIGKVGN